MTEGQHSIIPGCDLGFENTKRRIPALAGMREL